MRLVLIIAFHNGAMNTKLDNTEIAPAWNSGLGSCEPLVTFSSTD